MLDPPERVFLVLILIQFLLGMLSNGFIGLVNGISWFKSKRLSLPDFIITMLALSRMIILWILLTDGLLMLFFYSVHEDGLGMQMIDISWTFTNHLSIWLATCLSVFYCLKIANFSHPTFLWLKWRVSRMVVGMLLAAVLLSCASALSLIHEFKIYALLREPDGRGNVTEHFRTKSDYELFHILGNLWGVPPLLVSLASYLLLLLSLGRHTRQMQQLSGRPRDPSTEAHKKAIRIILSFCALFLLYYLSFLTTYSSHFLPATKMSAMVGEAITMFYPAGHSVILIMSNSKLKQTLVQMLWSEPGPRKPGSKGCPAPSRRRGYGGDPESLSD
ncbi:taste receptor type 2 member 3 [Sorex araneus]|uniref:taste receptor type 2 member 3 n=1 Tax=Sorex araneus TaxID=42254 RepID=UPI0024335ED3|nr:taste receptor type 2 member 3 [Sorex araneus]